MALFVYLTPFFQNNNKTFPWYYYALAILIFGIQQIFVYSMFVSQMAFFATVSDPKIGGTYMTLLNTLTNLGKRTNLSILKILLRHFQVAIGFLPLFCILLIILPGKHVH